MEQRALEVTILSAEDLNKVNLVSKMDVYIIVSISGGKEKEKVKTPVDRDGGSNPTWNFQAKFMIDEAAAQQNHLTIVFNVICERALGDKDIGEVQVLINELLQSSEAIDGKKQFVSYQVRKPDGKAKGYINFAYQFGDKVKTADQPTMAYPPPHGIGSSTTYPPPAPVYPPSSPLAIGFYPPPPHSEGYSEGGYPPPPTLHHIAPKPQGGHPHLPPPKHMEEVYPPQPSQYYSASPTQEGYSYLPPPHGAYSYCPPQYAGYEYPQPPACGLYPHPPPSEYAYPPPSE